MKPECPNDEGRCCAKGYFRAGRWERCGRQCMTKHEMKTKEKFSIDEEAAAQPLGFRHSAFVILIEGVE
jgi:hypothetical protein